MLVSSIIPVRFVPIPARAVVQSVYATAPAPYSNDRVRVRVLDVHTLAGRSMVAVVQIRPGYETWKVWASSLTNISAFVSLEVAE